MPVVVNGPHKPARDLHTVSHPDCVPYRHVQSPKPLRLHEAHSAVAPLATLAGHLERISQYLRRVSRTNRHRRNRTSSRPLHGSVDVTLSRRTLLAFLRLATDATRIQYELRSVPSLELQPLALQD